MKNKNAPELLAPGGSVESVSAAVAAGADGIYFGAQRFSARARAKNLDMGEVKESLSLCRAHGVKAYAAVNTRLRPGELSDALDTVEELLTLGTDAIIVADVGLASMIRETFPEASLHASTQISGTTAEDARVLRDLGFSRMVCPRELSQSEISRLVKDSPIGIEAFVHGAHCVSVSGQCSLSYVMGGRSGNRGDCAGPCRLPFATSEKRGDFALSLKDMCLARHLTSLTDAGVESLKIEGRLKGAEYTYGVVSVYRRLLDAGKNADDCDMAELREIFSRDGFSDGYYKNKYVSMTGVRAEGHLSGGDREYTPEKVPLTGSLRVVTGEPVSLTLTGEIGTATVTGDAPLPATGNPPAAESLKRSVSKLGSTPFVMKECDVEHDGICGIAAASLNKLRREAVDMLLAPAAVKKATPAPKEAYVPVFPERIVRCAVLTDVCQLAPAVTEYFDEVYLPLHDFLESSPDEGVCLNLPDVMYDRDIPAVKNALREAKERGVPVLVHGLGELRLAVEAGCTAHASHRFVVYSGESARVIREMGAASVSLSTEIPIVGSDVGDNAPASAVTGGRMPLMLLRRCPIHGSGKCSAGRVGGYDGKIKEGICRGSLRDRTGALLPTVGDRMCMTTLYNSVPTYCDLGTDDLRSYGVGRTYHIFSTETGREATETVENLRRDRVPGKFRRLR